MKFSGGMKFKQLFLVSSRSDLLNDELRQECVQPAHRDHQTLRLASLRSSSRSCARKPSFGRTPRLFFTKSSA